MPANDDIRLFHFTKEVTGAIAQIVLPAAVGISWVLTDLDGQLDLAANAPGSEVLQVFDGATNIFSESIICEIVNTPVQGGFTGGKLVGTPGSAMTINFSGSQAFTIEFLTVIGYLL